MMSQYTKHYSHHFRQLHCIVKMRIHMNNHKVFRRLLDSKLLRKHLLAFAACIICSSKSSVTIAAVFP